MHQRVFLIRHAATIQNNRVEKLLTEPSMKGLSTTLGDWIDLQTDPELIDTGLSQEGIK